jgi:hypothetical protein
VTCTVTLLLWRKNWREPGPTRLIPALVHFQNLAQLLCSMFSPTPSSDGPTNSVRPWLRAAIGLACGWERGGAASPSCDDFRTCFFTT